MSKAFILTRTTISGVKYTVYSGVNEDQKRVSLGTFQTREQAERVKSRHDENVGIKHESMMTLTEYINGPWQKTVDLEPTTRKGYLSYLHNHILPLIGHKVIRDITRTDILRLMDSLRKQGKTKNTINRCKMILSSVFSKLLDIEAIDQTPVVRIKAPRPAPAPRISSDLERWPSTHPSRGPTHF